MLLNTNPIALKDEGQKIVKYHESTKIRKNSKYNFMMEINRRSGAGITKWAPTVGGYGSQNEVMASILWAQKIRRNAVCINYAKKSINKKAF